MNSSYTQIYELFNTIKYTTYNRSYKIKYDYLMTEQVL